jgi:hypothetical protein
VNIPRNDIGSCGSCYGAEVMGRSSLTYRIGGPAGLLGFRDGIRIGMKIKFAFLCNGVIRECLLFEVTCLVVYNSWLVITAPGITWRDVALPRCPSVAVVFRERK